MNAAALIKSLIKLLPHISLLVLSLLWMYLTLGTNVRKTRLAFEKELTGEGMSKEDAKRLSACYKDLSDNITGIVKQNIRFGSVE